MEPKAAVLIVRRARDLYRVRQEVAQYWQFLNRHAPSNAPAALKAIWIDEEALVNIPFTVELPLAGGKSRVVEVNEAAGVSGLWMLCWLNEPAGLVSSVDLAAALLQGTGHDRAEATAGFLPVYSGAADARSAPRGLAGTGGAVSRPGHAAGLPG